jgi:hypothetical protein
MREKEAVMDIPVDIFDWREMAEIESDGDMRGGHPAERANLFLRLVFLSMQGRRFGNASQFEREVRRTKRAMTQATRVWDTCIRLGILTDDGRGFSLAKWLESKTRENLPSEEPVLSEATKYTTDTPKTRQKEKQAAKNGIDAGAGMSEIRDALPNGRVMVRDNIALTGPQLSGIRAVHGGNTERVLDEVSGWMHRTGARPTDIAGTIERWGIGGGRRNRQPHPLDGADLTLLGIEG